MINQHEFQALAKGFRAGRISLKQFTDSVFVDSEVEDYKGANSPTGSNEGGPANPVDATTGKSDNDNREVLDEVRTLPEMPARSITAHKGDFGRVLLIGGSAGMSGAISLAGLSALRSGSGLVKVAVPSDIKNPVTQFSPCYMTVGCLAENGEFHGAARDTLEHECGWADVVGLGPGMERGAAQNWIVPKLYASVAQPMVIDADGLNSLSDSETDLAEHQGQRILTPHPGEFQRLIGSQITDRRELEAKAIELAKRANVVIVLKGNRTLVTDGSRMFHNTTGNPGMATAGAGDVLTGIVTSLVGQGLGLFDAAVLGVHVHGMSGDLAAQSVGQTSLIATDLVDNLSSAFKKHASNAKVAIGFGGN